MKSSKHNSVGYLRPPRRIGSNGGRLLKAAPLCPSPVSHQRYLICLRKTMMGTSSALFFFGFDDSSPLYSPAAE